ncbi:hypothetical protein [Effusibacillus lacus]|uniref:Copper resistance protein D domain-containing protein n=1 Tax=Effusibacillus lacus TaxID=1348429 RepID=A0A292YKN6_9BACL|nr:hypothetical protein [Effusibacillus lacus]TCS75479.1 hypothetical protein EDD64_10734 [Effusibacillus lacus]GAX88944.1 hypothetical protein EFBL_0558 [Effusibacillus lacus]
MTTAVFYVTLALHLLAVAFKLLLLFMIPRLKNVAQVQDFLVKYKKMDSAANRTLWLTGGAMILANYRLLFQMWLLVSMLIYMVIFWIIKQVALKGMEEVAASKKIHAREELRKLRISNWCAIIIVFILLMSIGTLMMTKPF